MATVARVSSFLPTKDSSYMKSEAKLSWKIQTKACPGFPATKGSREPDVG